MLLNGKNLGYCITFNKAFRLAKGDYIIDLSADDLLLPERIEEGVKLFQSKGLNCGVIFSDARYIDEQGKELHLHSDNFPHNSIPQGEIYKELIKRYFICSPTMMIRKEVLVKLNGYDESLAFEDFDLWIRASRDYEFYYSRNVLVNKRMVNSSLSKKQFTKGDTQRWSTLKVCEKIKSLNRTLEERAALRKRLWYEIRLSLQLRDFALAWQFSKLLL
jgi:glycosyltransferase involved in cell wall biosynthesis